MWIMITLAAVCIGVYIYLYITSPQASSHDLFDEVREAEKTRNELRNKLFSDDEE